MIFHDFRTNTLRAKKETKYGKVQSNVICKDNKDVEGRNYCMSDEECIKSVRIQCDNDPNCFGVSWFPHRRTQPLKLCLSNELVRKSDGWRTAMKATADGTELAEKIGTPSNLKSKSGKFRDNLE